MIITIAREYEGRCGRTLTAVYTIFADGKEVGSSKRLWLARAIGDAISGGLIPATGDTMMAFTKWASENNRSMYERIIASGE